MPTKRVYATDSKVVPVYSYDFRGIINKVDTDNQRYETPNTISMLSESSGIATILTFDVSKIPEMQGMEVTGVDGPYIYITSKNLPDPTFETNQGSIANGYYTTRWYVNAFRFWDNGGDTSNNTLKNAPLNTYCDIGEKFDFEFTPPSQFKFTAALAFATYPNAKYADVIRRSGSASVKFDSYNMAHPPYIDVTFNVPSDVEIQEWTLSPTDGIFVNEKATSRLSWNFFGPYHVIGDIVQASAAIQFRLQGSTSYTEVNIKTANTYADMPPGTFANGNMEWRVSATTTRGAAVPYSTWQPFTTIDVTPKAPRGISPDARPIDGTEDNLFQWEHVIDTGTPQSRYQVQYSTDNGVTWTTYKDESTSRQNMPVAANTLPPGNLFWRVRTYSSDGVASPWSSAQITVRRAPDAPNVLYPVDGNPRPTITWQSVSQTCYQVTAPGYDSGELYGTAKIHQIPVFLRDGTHVISVRVGNEYEMWSAWGTALVTVQNQPGDAITLRAREIDCGVRLFWSGDSPTYQILRDGDTIAETTGWKWDDWLASAPDIHQYQVRGIAEDGFYTLSNVVKARTRVHEAAICKTSEWDWIPLRFRVGSPPEYSLSVAQEVSYHLFSGRRLPVADVFDRRNETFATSFSVSDELLERLLRLCGESVVLRYGTRLVQGVLDGVDVVGIRVDDDVDIQLSITMTEV